MKAITSMHSWFPVRTLLLMSGGLLGLVTPHPLSATLPLPTYPSCGADGTPTQCPPDIMNSDGTLHGDSWAFLHYMPKEAKSVRREEKALGSGAGTTLAWQTTTGRFDVTIAILDCGIRWREDTLTNKVRINRGELPAPRNASGQTCANDDCDGNGIFNVRDYLNDARVSANEGQDDADGWLDPSDLIAAFSDGVDDDADGYVDNIAGWDFLWNDNDPWTTNDFYHMTSVLTEAAAEGGEASSDIGHCPNCSVLPVRISDSFVGEGNKVAEGILYAVDHGADVIGMALGSMTNPEALQSAMLYAWDHGVTIVAAAGDELGYHHNYPGANDYAIYVHSIKYYPGISLESATSVLGYIGCNNFGARLDAVAPSNACATGSVAATSGMAGLIYSRAKDQGLELSPSEVRQLLLRNTDDISVKESQVPLGPYFPSYPGWDQFFGYGRVNVGKAVGKISARTIPPEIELRGPFWFEVVSPSKTPILNIVGRVDSPRASSYSYKITWAAGADPREGDFHQLMQSGSVGFPTDGTLATFDLSTINTTELNASAPVQTLDGRETLEAKLDKINARALTLRIQVTDTYGNMAEERRQIFLAEDPELLSGFPRYFGHSGEASPILYNIDGQPGQEILFATSEGEIHALRHTGAEVTGFPVRVGLMPGVDPTRGDSHLDSPAYSTGAVSSDVRQGIILALAVGDLEQDGVADIIAGTVAGEVYAYDAAGRIKSGFPVSRDPVTDADTDEMIWRDPGMFSSAVLYDLDNDGKLEIIQPSMDQKIYVWRYDGTRQPGFPVLLENPDGSTGVTTVAGRIVSSPAVGDIDDDGYPEIVVGSNEYVDDAPYIGMAYAIRHRGTATPGGAFVTGWPVEIVGLASGIINYIGEGVTPSPSLADINGDGTLEILLSGVGSVPVILRANGELLRELGTNDEALGASTNSDERVFVTVVSNGAIGDYDGGGDLEIAMSGTGLCYFESMGASRYLDFDHLAAAWKASSGNMLPAFPRVIEDVGFFNSPALADVSGDGKPEMLVGTSGYVLHAFKPDGSQPSGWPKFTGGWLIASPSVGDLDGDGKSEVVIPTREGYLFAWRTNGIGGYEWPSFRHDPQNTGNYEIIPETAARLASSKSSLGSEKAEEGGAGCSTSSTSSRGQSAVLALSLLALAAYRRRSRRLT